MEPTALYVRFRGQVSGPFSAEQLLAKVQAGQISTVHWVSEDQSHWVLAKDVPWLFPAATPGGTTQPPPAAVRMDPADSLASLAAALPASAKAAAERPPATPRPASPVAASLPSESELAAQARRLKWITITFAAAAVLMITALTTFVLYKLNQ